MAVALLKFGVRVMKKIPTIFERGDNFKVINKVRSGCEWVIAGEGIATEKLDGTNVRLTVVSGKCIHLEKRRNPTKKQKQLGIQDGWYVDSNSDDPADQWIFEAMRNTDLSDVPDGKHCAEALGPKIQGNPLKLKEHICVLFNLQAPVFENIGRTFNELRDALTDLESLYSPGCRAEGIVFRHEDGRQAKIKCKDF
ncbi:RNA ligase family protein [Moorena sp. SIOASIH]|uniref:RNA ligase family protein n=1 Tax=Moorena sp. SIOASIH TaxID=2607817 RepID=UPI0026014A57|nr:RNA ligase family protein [Moorena sp. SIOASIH]